MCIDIGTMHWPTPIRRLWMHRVPHPWLRVPVARHPLPWQHEHLRLMRHSRTSVLSNIIAGKCTKCTVAINRWSYHHTLFSTHSVTCAWLHLCTTVHVTRVTHRHTCSWTYVRTHYTAAVKFIYFHS